MATTTNYSWTTPDDTDLVKDGAAAIRTLGSAIDTTVFNNAGAAIAKTIIDAKGDLISATAADTPARLPVGTDGQYLAANSATSTGLEWQTVSAGGMTLISTLTPSSAAEVTFSSIPQTYKQLWMVGTLTPSAAGSGSNYLKLNNDTSTSYNRFNYSTAGSSSATWSTPENWHNNYTNTKPFWFQWRFFNYTETSSDVIKFSLSNGGGWNYTTTTNLQSQYCGYFWYYKGSNITSITLGSSTQTYTGTVYLYGVS